MPYLDYDHSGKKREYRCTAYTMFIYEQTFPESDNAAKRGITGDIISDVLGKVPVDDADGGGKYIRFDLDRWNAELRAFWTMLKTAEAIAEQKGKRHTKVPDWHSWILAAGEIDMSAISHAVVPELQKGCFRPAKAENPEEGDGEQQ